MTKKYWLFKSEPGSFSIDDLAKCENQTTFWDGIRNYRARNFLRDEMRKGDGVLFYHSGSGSLEIAGTCEIIRESYPDFTQFDKESKHYFPSATEEKPVWFMVDIRLVKKFKNPVSLDRIKSNPKLKKMMLIRKGNRLSVMPVEKEEWDEVLKMAS